MEYIALATEDALSEALLEKMISQYTSFTVDMRLGRRGNGYLKKNLGKFSQIAHHVMPLVVLTDLDEIECAPTLATQWLADVGQPASPRLLFRVAVREAESWLLSDHENIGPYLRADHLPGDVDSLRDPKRTLLSLARRAPSDLRNDLLPVPGSPALVGLGYNARLVDFVSRSWNPENGRARSNSLDKACRRLFELTKSES